ncbi:MAG: Gx transporter family protein [Oscillospiraceae bacterium]|nr:Gx transporter family protein [Oscillospiraceae bacterium]
MQTKRLTLLAMYTAIALTIFVVEAQIPLPIPVPGVKLGLANVITLMALLFLGRREAGIILAVRITLGSFFVGGLSPWLFSAAGGFFAFLTMALALRFVPKEQIWAVSTLGALAHNAGQLGMAVLYMGTTAVLAFAPVLVISAVITGAFIGIIARFLLRYERWLTP